MQDALASFLFVRCCPICGERVEDQMLDGHPVYICSSCMQQLPRTEQCSERGNRTEDLFSNDSQFERGAAFLFFDRGSMVREIVHDMKYKHYPELAYQLAHEAALDFLQSDFFDEIDVIIPIPLHPSRYRKRGYNQSEYIAKALSDVSGIPMDTEHLLRVKNNPQQARKKAKDRQQNVHKVFAVTHPEELYRKHILLVDDILTTGNTLHSCMEALHVAKGARYSVFVLGKAR